MSSIMFHAKRRSSFTLVEMLVVVVVILILAGIVLKLVPLISRTTAESRARYVIEQLRNALAEYKAEYAMYPPQFPGSTPANSMQYELESQSNQPPWFRTQFIPGANDPAVTNNFWADLGRGGDNRYAAPSRDGWELGYRYGLVANLWPRHVDGQNNYATGANGCWYDMDTDRDKAAKKKWAHFLADVGLDSGYASHSAVGLQGSFAYSNLVLTVLDPWERDYRYECLPPYIRYRLWSAGADGIDGTADDIRFSSESR